MALSPSQKRKAMANPKALEADTAMGLATRSRGIKTRAASKKMTLWTVSQLLETYRDPRAVLLEIASTPTAQLAEQMHGTLADALAERRLCAQAVLPYVAQKLPVQVDMRHTRAIHLNIVDERQYQDLVEVAATQDDADTFSMQLIPSAPSDDASSQEEGDATPVTPPVPAPDGERE